MSDPLNLATVRADKEQAELAEKLKGLADLRRNMPAIVEYIAIEAIMTRRKFQELVNTGFSEAQAIELCRKT